jgi:DEAD/DEAH box helicase domain-containing protein
MEDLVIDTQSPVILEGMSESSCRHENLIFVAHLQCAAQEMPICKEDEQYFGPLMLDVCENKLLKDKDGW